MFRIVTATLITSLAITGCVVVKHQDRRLIKTFQHAELGICRLYKVTIEYEHPFKDFDGSKRVTTFETECNGISMHCGETPDCAAALRREVRARQTRDNDNGGGGGGGGGASEPAG